MVGRKGCFTFDFYLFFIGVSFYRWGFALQLDLGRDKYKEELKQENKECEELFSENM